LETIEMALFRIGFVLFPRLTQLDLTGPYEILSRMRDAETLLVAKTLDPVPSERGLSIVPTATFADCPPLDLVCVPGGVGVNAVLGDPEILGFLRRRPSMRATSPRCAPDRWRSAPRACCGAGAPPAIGSRAKPCETSARSRPASG